MQARYIENLSTLTVLHTYSGCKTAKNTEGDFFLIADNLAISLDPKSLDDNGKFLDEASGSEIRKEFLQIYNPFTPEAYVYKPTDLTNYPHFVSGFKNADIIWYEKIYTYNPNEDASAARRANYTNPDCYAVSRVHPWIGVNVTQKFGLIFKQWGRLTNQLACTDSHNNEENYEKFLIAWKELKVKSHVSPLIQALINQKIVNYREAQVRQQQEAEELRARRIIIDFILRTPKYNIFKNHIEHLERLGKYEADAKAKADAFLPFIQTIKTDMNKDDFQTWLRQLLTFNTHFKGNFTPRPSFFGQAKTAEETTCYQDLQQLKESVMGMMDYHHYRLPTASVALTNSYSPRKTN